MNATIGTYVMYLIISIGLTVWVARTLSRNGIVFLEDVFAGKRELPDAVNRLLVVGFYLVNLGFVALYLRVKTDVPDLRGAFDALSVKVGTVLLVLGVLHLANVWVFSRMRRRSIDEGRTAPRAHADARTNPGGRVPPVQQAPGAPQQP